MATVPVRLPDGNPLVNELRDYRRRAAREAGVPPWRVLPNATLLAVARARPGTIRDLLAVSGIGPARAEAHGLAILAAVRRAGRRPRSGGARRG